MNTWTLGPWYWLLSFLSETLNAVAEMVHPLATHPATCTLTDTGHCTRVCCGSSAIGIQRPAPAGVCVRGWHICVQCVRTPCAQGSCQRPWTPGLKRLMSADCILHESCLCVAIPRDHPTDALLCLLPPEAAVTAALGGRQAWIHQSSTRRRSERQCVALAPDRGALDTKQHPCS